eukprot:8258479-Alexandrium_andersonii.AAC.1
MLAKFWKWALHINRGEMRAAVLWLRVLGRLQELRRCDVVCLTDSQVTLGCFQHARSSSYWLNLECRQRAALEFVGDVRILLTWVDTLHQPMDGGTRPDSFGRL